MRVRVAPAKTGRTVMTSHSNLALHARMPRLVALSGLLLAACGHSRGNWTQAEVSERLEDGAEYALDHVDASDEQAEHVKRTLRGLAPDIVTLRDEQKLLAADLRRELAKETLDRPAIEAIRVRSVALFERASQRGTQALVASAEELTPEQRQKLVARWEKHQR
jgi:Spy/CpxP family protein refolding chaperone